MSVKIIIGDCRDVLRSMESESVNCIVTSPPYWGLRDYGVDGQMGLERSLGEHLEAMVAVFEECRRVLRKDGTCWINYGDCYATSPNGRSAADTKAAGNDDRTFRDKPFSTVGPIYVPDAEKGDRRGKSGNKGSAGQKFHTGRIVSGGVLKPKDLCMVPNRLAIALQEAGWWVRSEIVWAKPNPMPESVTDRPATSHEKIWMLTRSARYWYDAEAVRETANWNPEDTKFPDGWDTGPGAHGSIHREGREKGRRSSLTGGAHGRHETPEIYPERERRDKQRGHGRRHAGFNERWDSMSKDEQQANGRNCRNVWTIATKPFSEAHFATFPPELAERCIKAGCPEGGIVLDPFGGAGTTGLVADRLQRDALLIELNSDYAEIARKRISGDAGMFSNIEVAA